METETMTMKQFVSANRITMAADWTDTNPNMEDPRGMDHWKVVLSRPEGTGVEGKFTHRRFRMTLVFSQGFGHYGRVPQVEDVLDCLASDSSCAGQDFEEWCAELGFDCDSRKAERTWKATQKLTEKLEKFLGQDLFHQITTEVERG